MCGIEKQDVVGKERRERTNPDAIWMRNADMVRRQPDEVSILHVRVMCSQGESVLST